MKLCNVFKKLLYLFMVYYIFGGVPQARGTNSELETKPGTVIELAIFCDAQFSKIFNGNSEKIIKYWGALVWDAHLKFQGVHGANISFRVNSITILKESDEREIVKHLRSADGTLPGFQLLDRFNSWLYDNVANKDFSKYDIAVLVVSSIITAGSELPLFRGACSKDTFLGRVESSFVISMRESQLGETFARELAHILNPAFYDEEDYGIDDCAEYDYLKLNFSKGYSGWHGLQNHMISPCAQIRILQFLQTEESSCLKHVYNNNVSSIVSTLEPYHWDLLFGAVSMEKQCQILVGSDAAYIKDEKECVDIICHAELATEQFAKTIIFDAFDGTECQIGNHEKGNCIFGKCIPSGVRLVNAVSGKCFHNVRPFLPNGIAGLSDCNGGTPLNGLFVMETGGGTGTEYVEIRALDFNDPDFEFGSICLTVNTNINAVTFKICKLELPEFVWEMRYLYDSDLDEFLLAHVQSNKCLTYLNSSTALMSLSSCSEDNARQRWKLGKYGMHNIECHSVKGWKYCYDFGKSTIPYHSNLAIVLSFLASIVVIYWSFEICCWCLRCDRDRRIYHSHHRRNIR